MKHTKIIKLFILFFVAWAGLGLLQTHRAYAFNLATVPNSQKSLMNQYDNDIGGTSGCYYGAPFEMYQQLRWLSPNGNTAVDSSVTPTYFSYNQAVSLSLKFNTMVFLCSKLVAGGVRYPADSTPTGAAVLTATRTHVISGSATAGTVSGSMIGGTLNNTKIPSSRFWGIASGGFTYSKPGGFQSDTDVTITLQSRVANTYSSGQTICVANGVVVPSVDSCPLTPLRVILKITINPNNAPGLNVSNPKCSGKNSPTTFTITSGDQDAPNPNNVYPVHWQLQNWNGSAWVDGPTNKGDPKLFGNATGVQRTINFVATPSNAVPHRILVETFGYGVPRRVTDSSASWPACNGPVDRAPSLTITPDCALHIGGIVTPGFSITSTDPNPGNYTINWAVNNAANTIGLASGVMAGPWVGGAPPDSHRASMYWVPGYNPGLSYWIYASTQGFVPGGAVPVPVVSRGPILFPNCAPPPIPFTLTPFANKPVLLPDDQTPTSANFSAVVTSNRSPVNNIPNTRSFFIIKLVGGTQPAFATANNPFSIATGSHTINDTNIAWPSVPPVVPGDQICETISVPTGGTVDSAGTATFDPTYIPSTMCVTVTARNYFGVYGGDVFAGTNDSSTITNCSGWGVDNLDAGIFAFKGLNGGASVVDRGAASEAGVFALGPVDHLGIFGFSSSRLRAVGANGPPNYLTFANTGVGSPGSAGLAHCPYDYYGNKFSGATTVGLTGVPAGVDVNTVTANALNNFSVKRDPGPTVRVFASGAGVLDSKRINLYVDGDIYINSNIAYAGAGSWSSVDQIPRVQVVAKGNIYIGPGVSRLDGIYVAQPDGSPGSGTIYTCSDIPPPSAGPVTNPSTLYTICKNQLTVNGALIAARVKWLRTFGSLGQASPIERPTNIALPQSCQSAGVNVSKPTCASEVINFTPETYLVTSPSVSNADTSFDSVLTLPPLL